MRPNSLTNNGDGLHPTGLTLETAHEILTAASALDYMATLNDLTTSVYANMALALRSKTAKAVEDASQAEHCFSKPIGTMLTLRALGATATDHPEMPVRNDAADMLKSYELAILELQFGGPSASPQTH